MAAALIGLAIGGLALVDRFRDRPARSMPSHEPAQALITTPAPDTVGPTGMSDHPAVPPPPPVVINSESLAPPAPATPAQLPRSVAVPDGAAHSDKPYVIQVGVFTSTANARAMQKQLKRAGLEAHLETRVQLGPFRDKREADRALARARKLGIDAVLVNAR